MRTQSPVLNRIYDSLLVQVFQKLGYRVLVHKDKPNLFQTRHIPFAVKRRAARLYRLERLKLEKIFIEKYLDLLAEDKLYFDKERNKELKEYTLQCSFEKRFYTKAS